MNKTIVIPRLPIDGDFPITARVGDVNTDNWKDGHKGTDFGSIKKDGRMVKSIAGEPFKAVWPGRVDKASWHMIEQVVDGKKQWVKGPLGVRVWVVSEIPMLGQIRHGYCHAGLLSVAEGVLVEEGQQLGTVGNTGNSSAPHLHWQIETYPERQILAPDLDEYFARLAKAGIPPTAV